MKNTIVLAFTIIAAAVAVYGLLHGLRMSPPEEVTADTHPPSYAAAVESGAPTRLLIPAIEVDAHVEHVGIAPSGNMAVPYAYENVGWFRSGPIPGALGSAVIDGHVDTGFGGPAVFARLHELSVGDVIYVESGDGEQLAFEVEEVMEYAYNEVPSERLFSQTDAPRLNLITCAGEWNQTSRSYDRRVVVYTRLVVE